MANYRFVVTVDIFMCVNVIYEEPRKREREREGVNILKTTN
jgi:hypothetical protein